MQEKPMLILTLILTTIVCLYFFFVGFSIDRWTRYGQYCGLFVCFLMIIDSIFNPL